MTMTKRRRKRKMDQPEIECIICNQTKKRAEYYGTSSYCKECHKEYMSEKSISNRREFLHKCITNGKLKLEDYNPADRLLISCQSRHKACKYDEKGYEDIECNYTTPFEFFLVLLNIEGFFSKWIDLYNCWIASEKNRNALPIIDRIDESGHYVPDNVQPLTHLENTLKARRKACTAILFKDGDLLKTINFKSKQDCNEQLADHIPINTVKKLSYDTPYLQDLGNGYYLKVQTDNVALDDIWSKMQADKRYKLVVTNITTTIPDTKTRLIDKNIYNLDVKGIAFTYDN